MTQFRTAMLSSALRGVVPRKADRLFIVVSLLPLFVFGPMGPGAIIIHHHQEEDLHTHRMDHVTVGQGASKAADGHDHPAGTLDDLEGTCLVLVLPDLPRVSTSISGSQLQAKSAPLPATPSILLSVDRIGPPPRHGPQKPEAPLRAHDLLTHLLLSSNSLLI